MNKLKQLIIIGSGSSLKEGISKGLWDKLKGKLTVGLNYTYNFFDSTVLCYVDEDFYKKQREQLKSLSLIIGKEHQRLNLLPNTITLKTNDVKYYRDIKLGCYKSNLAGLFALSLGIYLLDEGEIFLLGFDYGTVDNQLDSKGRRITHFYDNIEHRGIGKCNYYDTIGRGDKDFGVYSNETKCKIYNVSLESKITIFPKLSWETFFEKLDNNQYNQEELREYIKGKLK